jgi:lysyl-tRNA synthetase class 2
LIGEIEALLHCLFAANKRRLEASQIISYQDAFLNTLAIDPLQSSPQELAGCAQQNGVDVQGLHSEDRDFWLDVLMSHCVQPHLGRNRLTFVRDYPASQAALAQFNPNNNQTALRFELFIDGVELANGFQELTDAVEQRRRFQRQLARRATQNQVQPPIDEYFLQALAHGMPECSGVALGLDRVIMILAQATTLSEIMAFPMGRI